MIHASTRGHGGKCRPSIQHSRWGFESFIAGPSPESRDMGIHIKHCMCDTSATGFVGEYKRIRRRCCWSLVFRAMIPITAALSN